MFSVSVYVSPLCNVNKVVFPVVVVVVVVATNNRRSASMAYGSQQSIAGHLHRWCSPQTEWSARSANDIPENVGLTSGGEEWRPPLFSGDEPSSYETDDVHPPMEYHVFSWLPFIVHPEKVEPVCNSVPSSLPQINFYIFLSEVL